MPIELNYLVASIILFIVMVVVQAAIGARSHSMSELVGPRDNFKDKTAAAERARRANQNMIEGLAMFAPLILVVAVLGRYNEMTALGAALFFWGRLGFAPMYWLGVPWVRTLAWFVSVAGIVLVLLQILPFAGA